MQKQTASSFARFATWLARWTGSHWAFFVGAALVTFSLIAFGIDLTNIAISIVIVLMLFILQNTQNRDSAALHMKLDELMRHTEGPRDEVAGIEFKTHDEIEALRETPDDSIDRAPGGAVPREGSGGDASNEGSVVTWGQARP